MTQGRLRYHEAGFCELRAKSVSLHSDFLKRGQQGPCDVGRLVEDLVHKCRREIGERSPIYGHGGSSHEELHRR